MAAGALSLLAVLAHVAAVAGINLRTFDGARGCADLANKGTHFTIEVDVGTPSQRFSVVADTGSNSLIVPSCACQQKGKCSKEDRCFTGTNKSSSFKLELTEEKEPVSMVLSFGSGQIQAVVAQEQVKIGGLNTKMADGVLLMTDRALNINGPFEGILGLGLPQPATNWTEVEEQEKAEAEKPSGSIQDIIKQIISKAKGGGGSGSGGNADVDGEDQGGETEISDEAMRRIMQKAAGNTTAAVSVNGTLSKARKPVHRDSPRGFLEQAKIGRFSMCFNDGSDGVLRIGEPRLTASHAGMGTAHWGVDFRGVSVGNSSIAAKSAFCTDKEMQKGQKSPCGAIPDSGTTLMLGPAEHITELLEDICERWPRCKSNYTKLLQAEEAAAKAMKDGYGLNPFDMKIMNKSDVIQLMLQDCDSWLDKGGLAGMPDLHFHIRGSNGTSQALKIPARTYIMEMPGDNATSAYKLLNGVGNIPMDPNATKGMKRVCAPAFGTMDYNTKANGPVWILGTPLFYEYVVGYDMDTTPPEMNFLSQDKTPCGSCSGTVELATSRGGRHAHASQAKTDQHMPRRVSGAPRLPVVDITKPL